MKRGFICINEFTLSEYEPNKSWLGNKKIKQRFHDEMSQVPSKDILLLRKYHNRFSLSFEAALMIWSESPGRVFNTSEEMILFFF